jgi:hypothetical protein
MLYKSEDAYQNKRIQYSGGWYARPLVLLIMIYVNAYHTSWAFLRQPYGPVKHIC